MKKPLSFPSERRIYVALAHMPEPKFVVVDGNAIIHRAYHAIPPLTTKDGLVVNAVYGFVSMMLKMLSDLRPEYVAVTFDEAGPTFRHKKYDKYKATRVKADQALYDQIPLVKQVVQAFNFPIYSKAGYEADDVIGTIVKKAYPEPVEVFIVTGDMDTLQLVNGKVKIYTLRKGLTDVVVYDEKAVEERFGFGPKQVVDYKALRGDASDNIPGVPGIGEKTAAELIQKLGSLDNIYKKLSDLKSFGIKDGVVKKLTAGKESAYVSRELSDIDCQVPDLKFNFADCKVNPFDREKIVSLFQKLEFVSLLRRLPELREMVPAEEQSQKIRKSKRPEFNFEEIKTAAELRKITDKILLQKKFTARVLLDSDDFFKSKPVGLILVEDSHTFFIGPELLKEALVVFEHPEVELIGHDLKQLFKTLQLKENRAVRNKIFDTMIASYLLNPGSRAHDLPSLVLKVLGKELTAASGQESLFGVDKRQVAYETFLVLQISEQLKKDLDKVDDQNLFGKVEMPLIPVLAQMELNGVAVDSGELEKLSTKVNEQLKEITQVIYNLAGTEFNISSPIQLREILFDKLEIPTDGVKKGKTGLSTSAEELERLKGQHPIIDAISSYRELSKLQNTYVDVLPKLINPKTRRIHTTFNQAVTATGRLSSSDPNLQNIPIRTELGNEIRKAFVAEKGNLLISADYSQIQLRIAASLANDQKMIEIFKSNEDIHRATAAAIHGVPLEKVTKEMRRSAKEVNFGVLFGMGVYGLSWRAEIPHAEAREFIDKYFREFSGVKKFVDQNLEFAKKHGYCKTLLGRRRYLPELHSSNYQLRSAAERMAISHSVQGSEADIMKIAMINLSKLLTEDYPNGEVKMILQVHDELVFEARKELVEEVSEKIRKTMETVVDLKVPIKVDVAAGRSWCDTK